MDDIYKGVIAKWSNVSLIIWSEPVEVVEGPEIAPHTGDTIEGDGNCLFRAISKEVTGTQKNHEAVRDAIVNFMVAPAIVATVTSQTSFWRGG